MKFVKGNILDVKYGIIGHQVNCQLVMGAGLARQIKEKYPIVFNEYKRIMGVVSPADRLGKCQMVAIIPDRFYFANLFGQFYYYPRRVVHTDYIALGMALRNLKRWKETFFNSVDMPIYLPSGLGCGLAGGDWNLVQGLISDAIPDAIIVRLER